MPILKLVTVESLGARKIDITWNTHSGERCVQLVRHYIRVLPTFKPLIVVLKQMFQLAKLNNPYNGGLSSYGVTLLLVAFLQYSAGSRAHDTKYLGSLLLSFFKF